MDGTVLISISFEAGHSALEARGRPVAAPELVGEPGTRLQITYIKL